MLQRWHIQTWAVCLTALLVESSGPSHAATLPAGFTETQVGGTWNEVVGITFAEDGTPFVWERQGRVYMFHENVWHLVLNIAEEVGGWRDFGLLGLALHPNFLNNGQIFLFYVVDRHHLLHFGTPQYNPNTNEYFNATIGRITRYTLDPAIQFTSIVPGSRLVLVGESQTTGFPILHESHGTGSLVFGADGTLLASCGDGASFLGLDLGGTDGGAYGPQALADGIITPRENVGAYRAQLVDGLNGKIIRIDPNTGDGLPTNPFYDATAPRAPRSRVWALGLRNPCRMTLRPGTGSHNPQDADPGMLYIGDVGMDTWEDMNVCTGPRQNFGWPRFEGLTLHSGYGSANVPNLDAPNPLFGLGSCTQQYFYFRNLIIQDTPIASPSFPNPCNANVQIPDTIPKFVHRRPEIDWGHGSGPARTGIFIGNTAAVINVGAAGSPVQGPQFGGNCSIGGAWYIPPVEQSSVTAYPTQYHNTYFHAEFGSHWIKSIVFDATQNATLVQNFATNTGDIVAMAAHPVSGDLHYVRWDRIYKIAYTPSANQPPTAIAQSDIVYGPTPLTVQFNGSTSLDPENQPLEFSWDFDDGTPGSNEPNPTHVFVAPKETPTQFNVTLTVTDVGNLTSQHTIIISVNNTPPAVNIVSPVTGSTYPMSGNTVYNLVADISDAEHDASGLSCTWQTVLHHNAHTHPEPTTNLCQTTTTLSPAGCDGNTYFYRVSLSVNDAAGLSSSDFVDVYPNCSGNQPPQANDDTARVQQYESVDIHVLTNDSDADGTIDPATVAIVDPPNSGTVVGDPLTGTLTYQHNGSDGESDTFGYTVNDEDGGTSNVALVTVSIEPVVTGDVNGDGVVNVIDLLAVVAAWGPCPVQSDCPADLAPPGGNSVVDVSDLLMVIANWG